MTIDLRASATEQDFVSDVTQNACSADGIALLAEGRFQEALAPLRMALALGDPLPSTMLNLAIAEDRAGSRDHARRLMHRVAARLPDWDEPLVRLAESLRAAGETAAAEEAYRRTLDLNPGRSEALIALSGLLLMRKQAGRSARSAVALLRHRAGQRRGMEYPRTGPAHGRRTQSGAERFRARPRSPA